MKKKQNNYKISNFKKMEEKEKKVKTCFLTTTKNEKMKTRKNTPKNKLQNRPTQSFTLILNYFKKIYKSEPPY